MKRLLTLSAIVLGLVFQAGNVSASSFRVTPIRVVLEKNNTSALLTLTNESAEALRFKISAFSWSQDPAGSMKLEPTQDIQFFPAMLTLEGGKERKIRVSTKLASAAIEQSYRIFFEELPPLSTPENRPGAQVRILTKMGVPIFVAPTKVVESARIDNPRVEGGKLRFAVRNEGTVRFGVQGVSLQGLAADGSTILEQQLDGWYVLAGTERVYEFLIPSDVCSRLKSMAIVARTDSLAETAAAATARIDVSLPQCK